MSLMVVLHGDDVGGVGLPNLGLIDFEAALSPLYRPVRSGIRFGADGKIYRAQTLSSWGAVGTWLFKGSASSYYLSRTVVDGSLTSDAGAGPLQMSTNRDYSITTAYTERDATVYFSISNSTTGSPILAEDSVFLFVS